MKNSASFFFVLFALLIFPAGFARAQETTNPEEGTTNVEETGGVYPTESQGSSTSEIKSGREPGAEIPSPGYSAELHITSQTQNEVRPHYFVLDGYVDIAHQSMRLQADHAEYDTDTQILVATGNVVFDQEGERITGQKLVMNMNDQTGTMYKVFGYVPPQIFFWGEKLEKTGKDEYVLYDGTFTECSLIKPHWTLLTTKARMNIDDYVHFNKFELKAKSLPIFYSPYMLWPIKRDRATGFLFPSFGPNTRKGFYTGGSFFWAMNDWMDSTYWLDHWMIRGWGGGAEYRYASGEKAGGSSKFYYANDNELGPQWSLNTEVNQDLPGDFRLASIVDIFSSFEYIQETADNFSRAGVRTQRAQGFLTRNWSYYSLNILGDWNDTQFQRTREVSFSHQPEMQFQSRSQKLGPTPLFWSLDTSFDKIARGDSLGQLDTGFSFNRFDVYPLISWPITYLSWLTFTPSYAYRTTYYSNSQAPLGSKNGIPQVTDESITRTFNEIQLDLRGPNFSKIFDTPNWDYSRKWKHAIEPEVVFNYRQNVPDLFNIFKVDDVDQIAGQKTVTFSLTNLLYAKKPVEEQEHYKPDEYHYYDPPPSEPPVDSPWELISWRLSETYNFDSDLYPESFALLYGRLSPLSSLVRVNPSQNYNIEFEVDYDLYVHLVRTVRTTVTLKDQTKWYANASYTYTNQNQPQLGLFDLPQLKGNFIRLAAGSGLWKNMIVLGGELDYDANADVAAGEPRVQRASLSLVYNQDCFTVGIEWRRQNWGDLVINRGKENQVLFTISLPNIGSLVNYRNGAPASRF